VRLDALTRVDCERVRAWRNADLSHLRTPFALTGEQQEEFYQRVVCARDSPHRYYAIREGDLIGMGGLTNISWENGSTEISLIIAPSDRSRGYGTEAVKLLLAEAFGRLRLATVYGECYLTNPQAAFFWKRLTEALHGTHTVLPRRKWWDGKLWDALYFSIPSEDACTRS